MRHFDVVAFGATSVEHILDILHAAIHPVPADVTIATKVSRTFTGVGKTVRQAVEMEFRPMIETAMDRLGVDVLDLVYLHREDTSRENDTPTAVRETYTSLAALRDEGLIRQMGVSGATREDLKEIGLTAEPIAAVQNAFNIANQADSALVDECAADNIAYIARKPLDGLTTSEKADLLQRVADRHGATANQVAIAWALARSPSIVQIPGTATIEHLIENLAAADLVLDREDIALLSA